MLEVVDSFGELMSKNQMNKIKKSIETCAGNINSMASAIEDVILAQNNLGVVSMTLMQVMIERGLITEDSIQERITANEKLVMDANGNCVKPLSTILDQNGDPCESTAGEEGDS